VLPSGHVLFRFNAFDDSGGRLSAMFEEIFAYLRGAPAHGLVIDLRHNHGGATLIAEQLLGYLTDRPYQTMLSVQLWVSRELKESFLSYVPAAIRWLPIQYLHPLLRPLWLADEGQLVAVPFGEIVEPPPGPKFEGATIVLSGPGAYSSSAILLATMKKYHVATLVGTPSGGHPTHYGNSIEQRLPNTGLLVFIASSVNRGHGVGPVQPDHLVEQTVEDLRLGRDTQLDQALGLLEDQPS